MRAEHRRLSFSISVDKNAAYPEAFSTSQEERIVPKDCKLGRVKYLNVAVFIEIFMMVWGIILISADVC